MIQSERVNAGQLILALVMLCLVAGCGGSRNFIQRDSLYDIQNHMTPANVVREVAREPLAEHAFEVDGVNYLAYRYDIRVARDDSDASAMSASVNQYNARMGGSMITPTHGNATTEAYFFLFKEDRLCFHGLLDEMKEAPDRDVRDKSRLVAAWYQSAVNG